MQAHQPLWLRSLKWVVIFVTVIWVVQDRILNRLWEIPFHISTAPTIRMAIGTRCHRLVHGIDPHCAVPLPARLARSTRVGLQPDLPYYLHGRDYVQSQ